MYIFNLDIISNIFIHITNIEELYKILVVKY